MLAELTAKGIISGKFGIVNVNAVTAPTVAREKASDAVAVNTYQSAMPVDIY